jgi:hypothetical protein
MTVTVTCDHRHIYGADAAEFLKDLAGKFSVPLPNERLVIITFIKRSFDAFLPS